MPDRRHPGHLHSGRSGTATGCTGEPVPAASLSRSSGRESWIRRPEPVLPGPAPVAPDRLGRCQVDESE
jgi:hypothetical protein